MMPVSVATSRQKQMGTTDLRNAPLIHHLFRETSKGSLFLFLNIRLTRNPIHHEVWVG